MAEIALRGVDKHFGDNHVIRHLDLTIADREFVVLLGPSGCGKTTTLRAIAGLEEIDSGEIVIGGKPVQDLHASDRDIAFVFQLYALYPHLSVHENVAFPLKARGIAPAEVEKAVRAVAEAIGISHLLKRKPSALSGGDMQRVAIARSLVRRPQALLMDEPIGALDAKLREQMRIELKRLHLENDSTSIYVTHDQVEAMSLADRIVIMHEGVVQQVGDPSEVYSHPANLFVAQFIGSPVMNIAPVTVEKSEGKVLARIYDTGFDMPAELTSMLEAKGSSKKDMSLGVRPEGIKLSRSDQPGYVPAEAHIIQPFGPFDIVDLRVGGNTLRARSESGFVPAAGTRVWARLDPAQTHFFDSGSGQTLDIRLG